MMPFRKCIASVLATVLTLQPAIAAVHEYRVPLSQPDRSVQPASPTGATPAPAPGTGMGDVVVGDEPGTPTLEFAPAKLSFNLAKADDTLRSSLLTNTGAAPAVLAAFTSTASFSVSSDCPQSLAPGDSCLVAATRTPAAVDGSAYSLVARALGTAQTATLQLAAALPVNTGPGPSLSVDHDLVSLGEVAPGVASSASVVLSNTGGGAANLRGIVSNSEFAVSSDCPTDLAPGASCTIAATFAAVTAGTHKYTMLIRTSMDDEGLPVTFYAKVIGGTVPAPVLAFSTQAVMFSPVNVGESTTQQFTLKNNGTADAMLAPLASAPGFAITSDCPATLPVSGQCNVSATFTGTTAGSAPSYQLLAKAQGDLSTGVMLQGRVNGGTAGSGQGPGLAFNPTGLGFGSVWVGQPASLQTTLTNGGTSAAAIKSVAVDLGGGDFTQANDCGESIAAGASCTFSVTFRPATMDWRIGRVLVKFSDGSELALPVSGYGIYAGLSAGPATVQYGGVVTTGTLPARAVWLGNGGNIPLTGLAVVNNDSRLAISYGNCTNALAARQGCALSVSYTPAGEGPFSTSFQVTSSNGGSATVNVTGTVVKLTATPSRLTFPTTNAGTSAPDQSVILTNAGRADAVLDGMSVTYGVESFNQSNNCGGTLAPGASCTVTVRFTPQQDGALAGAVDVSAAGSLVLRVGLSGTGYVPKLTLTSTSLTFPETNVGKTAAPLSVIVSNATNVDATITGVSIVEDAAEFAQSNNCGASLAPNASCTVSVQWTPQSTATSMGSLAIASSLGTYGVGLRGTPTQPVAVIDNPTTTASGDPAPAPVTTPDGVTHFVISFPDTQVGMSSAVRNITFNNTGTGPLGVQGISVVAGASDFSQSNNCGTAIAPGSSCTISTLFSPSAAGARSGSIVIASDTGTYSFDLSGKGLGALVQLYAQSSSDFGNVVVGSSAQGIFTFQNAGTVAAHNVSAALTGAGFTLLANSCGTDAAPVTVAAGSSCSMTVQTAPTAAGSLNAKLVVASDAANGSQSLSLTAKAIQAVGKLSADTTTDFGSAVMGTSSSLKFTFLNSGDADATGVAASVSGAGMSLTSNTCGTTAQPGTVGIGKVCSMTVQFSPTAVGSVSGSLTVLSSARTSPDTLTLTGSGKYSSNSYQLQFNGANGSTTISDTGTGSSWYSYNGAAVTTAIYREGTGALNLNGSNQAVYGPAITFTSDFTASAWVRPTARPANVAAIIGQWRQTTGQGAWLLAHRSDGTVSFSWAPYSEMGPMLASPAALPLNQWSQVAISKSGTSFKLSINGVVVASTTNSGNAAALSVPFSIGSYYTSSGTLGAFNYFSGQIDDVRVLTGSGAGNFAFNASTLSAADTDFGVVDLGTTATQTVAVRNSGTVPATIGVVSASGDFTVKDATACKAATLAPGASCSVTVAFAPAAVGTRTGTLTLGYDAGGTTSVALSGTGRSVDPNFSKVVLLLHLDGNTVDSSPVPKTVSVAGSVSTAAAPYFGTGALSVADTNSGLVAAGQSEYAFAPGVDFTIEAFIKPTATATYKQIVGQWGSCLNAYQLSLYSGKLGWERPGYGTLTSSDSSAAVSLNAWHHVAVARQGSTISLYLDGKQVATASDSINYATGTCGMGVGKVATQNGYSFGSGSIDEVRITRQLARYTGATYTVPTQSFPNQ
jgi:hypothetical protein